MQSGAERKSSVLRASQDTPRRSRRVILSPIEVVRQVLASFLHNKQPERSFNRGAQSEQEYGVGARCSCPAGSRVCRAFGVSLLCWKRKEVSWQGGKTQALSD